MSKKKIVIIILTIFLFVLTLFLACTIRKMIIIKDLSKKVAEYQKSKNYYIKIVNNIGSTTEYYCKEDNAVLFLKSISKTGDKTNYLKNYYKSSKTNTYIESGEDKRVILDSNGLPSKIIIIGLGDTNNLWQLFKVSLVTSIKKGEYNGKSCYILNLSKQNEEYREIETGLRVKAKEGRMTDYDNNGITTDVIVEYSYEFNNVDENIFIEPDISEYKTQEL